MARVCVIRCHHFPRDERVGREVSALLQEGHQVDVICLRGAGEALREKDADLSVWRLPLRHRMGASAGRLLGEYTAFFLVASLFVTGLHLSRRFRIVQVNSVPDVLVFSALGPRLLGARVIIDLQEPMPEFFSTKFGTHARHPLVRLITMLEGASIRFADAAITVTEQMRDAFVARGARRSKIAAVMDGPDEAVFDPKHIVRRSREPNRLVLISHGTIEPHYGLDTVIRAVAQLQGEIPGLEFQIVGDGSHREWLRQLAKELNVDGAVSFSDGFVSRDELLARLGFSDVGVVAMQRDPFRDLTIAGKMFDFIALRIPMVVSWTRSVEETFGPGCFEGFTADDPEDLARAIRALYLDPTAGERYARRAAEVAERYRWTAQRERYLSVVNNVLARPTR